MPDEEKALYDLILKGYQNRLANFIFELEKVNAQLALKVQRIQELEAERAPKPGPR